MKKIFTLFLLFSLIINLSAQKKTVGYYYTGKFDRFFTRDTVGSMAPGAQFDPLLELLKTDENFTVTELTVPGNKAGQTQSAPKGWNDYDIVVLQESPGSAHQIVKDLNLSAVTKPYLINKMYGFKAGSLFTTGAGAGLEANDDGKSTGANGSYALKVKSGQSSNPLLNGCTITNDTIHCFNKLANDTGALNIASSAKAINYNSAVVDSGATIVCEPYNIKAGTCVIGVNTYLDGGKIGSSRFTNKVITIGFNYGAMCANNMQNITPDALSICRNAVYILGGLTPPTTPALNPTVNVKSLLNKKNLSYIRIENQVQINFGQVQKAEVSVYSITGKLLSKKPVNGDNVIIELQGSGINIVKVEGDKVSASQKFSVY